ncbi:TPA: hypothetical protein ENG04_01670 [Candidatus Poribacteria bacterium]|nr:hypothetical protein [Candidatus Poribacteria bacterium]HEX28770.1 hypothetical protein [Candidatus Poribacteria bacterium]
MRWTAYLLLALGAALPLYGQNNEVIFYEGFDDIPAGKIPEGWLSVGKLEVASFPSSTDKSLHIIDQGSGSGAKLNFDAQKKGVFSVEYSFLRKKGSSGGDVEILYIIGSHGDQPFNGVCVAMHPGGGFTYNDGGAWKEGEQIKDEEWHTFKYVINMDKNKWDLIYDDKEVATGVKFRGNIGDQLDTIIVSNYVDGGTNFEIYFNDIIIYSGTKRPIAVEAKDKLATTWGLIKNPATAASAQHGFRDF